jgi:pimeloyl-ACP methyl ester carboxylesterase
MVEGHEQAGQDRMKTAVIAGLIAALAGGSIWAVIVVFTGYEVGWVAWGVGGLVGFAMARATPTRSRALGVRAAVLAAAGLLIGKWLIIEIGSRTNFAAEVMNDQELMRQAVFLDLYEGEQLPPRLVAVVESLGEEEEVPDSVVMEIEAMVDERLATMSEDEMEASAERFVAFAVGDLGFMDRMYATMSGWDLLWFFLAIGTAWKLTTPTAREEEGVVEVGSGDG